MGENKACDAGECMETEGHRALKYNSQKEAHSSWLTILISPLLQQISHYVELLPGTLICPSRTQCHRPWDGARSAVKEGHRRVKAAMLKYINYTSAGDRRGSILQHKTSAYKPHNFKRTRSYQETISVFF